MKEGLQRWRGRPGCGLRHASSLTSTFISCKRQNLSSAVCPAAPLRVSGGQQVDKRICRTTDGPPGMAGRGGSVSLSSLPAVLSRLVYTAA